MVSGSSISSKTSSGSIVDSGTVSSSIWGSGVRSVKQYGQAWNVLGGVTERIDNIMGSWISLLHIGFGQITTTVSSDNLAASRSFVDRCCSVQDI